MISKIKPDHQEEIIGLLLSEHNESTEDDKEFSSILTHKVII